MKKPIIEIKINSWNKRTKKQKSDAVEWLMGLTLDLVRGAKLSDKFWGQSK